MLKHGLCSSLSLNATFLNSYIASTIGDTDKIWHRDKPAFFIVPVKNFLFDWTAI